MIMIMADCGWWILHNNWHLSSVMYMTIHYLWFRNETPNVEKNHAAWPTTKATCLHQDLPSFSSHHRLGNIQWIQHDQGWLLSFHLVLQTVNHLKSQNFAGQFHIEKKRNPIFHRLTWEKVCQSCFHPSRGGGPPRFPTWTGLFRSRTSKSSAFNGWCPSSFADRWFTVNHGKLLV